MYVHSSRILKQIEVLTSRGIPVEPVYDLAQITPQEVTDPGKMFSFEQFHSVLEYAIEQTGDEYYGLRLGQEPYLAGTIGMMCASCRNLKEAFIQGCKYFEVQGNFAEIRFIKDTQYPKIEYTLTNAWRLKYPETARHEVDAVFSYLVQVLTINSNNTIKPYQVLLTREVPEDNHDYKKIFGIIPQFEQEKNVIVFREKDLLIPMKAFNPDSFQLLKNHIENQLKRFKNKESVSEKVKSVLLSSLQYQFPDIETVALKLNTSARTLQRQLSDEKTNFKTILQETRFGLARELLRQNNFTISEISYTLGYSDIGNFSRSFKKITGKSPQEFKNVR